MAGAPVEPSLRALANTRADKLSNQARGWRTQLESLRARRAIIYGYMFCMHIYYPLKNNYARKYDTSQVTTTPAGWAPPDRVNGSAQSSRWHWRAFPRMWPVLVWYRVLNSAYLAYMVLRTLYPPLLEAPLQRLMGAFGGTRPAKCYLLGRLEPNYARRAYACMFALYHLEWRYNQVYDPAPNYTLSTIYFLLFDDRDILHYYQRLAATGGVGGGGGQRRTTDDFFHEIMSRRRLDAPRGLAYRLRPNRTPAASRALRKYLMDSTVFWASVFVPLASAITTLLIYFNYRTSRYLAEYPGCSPELERVLANHPNASPSWLDWQLRWHQFLSLAVDTLENAIIWTENGIATVFSFPVMMVIHYDLILYWRCLNARLERVLAESRQEVRSPAQQSDLYDTDDDGNDEPCDDDAIYELQLEWQDFIKQIEHADAFIGEAMTVFIVYWLSLFAVFTYETLSMRARSMPPGPKLIIFFIVALVTSYYARLVVLHRLCMRSYTKICSLMAHDRSVHRMNFIQIMDYFARRRTCYTLCRQRKMTATTYLNIVGWSFSSYFILVGVNHGGRR